MRRILALAAVIVAAGCASGWDGSNLTPGVSTAAEVEASMGRVAERRPGPDGSTVLWFPRLPSGRVSFAATIGKDGKLISVEQRLTRENLQRIRPGTSREDDVRDLLGPPQRVDAFPRRQRTAWTWQADGIEPQIIVVEFSPDGVVRDAFMIDDPALRSRDGGMT